MTLKISLAAVSLALALTTPAQAQLFGWGKDSAAVPQAETTSGKMAADTAVNFPDIQEMVLGEADAPVEIIEYASYTCPHCANFHQTVFKDLKKDYIDTGKVRFVYREVYFDKYGMWGSLLARCAGPERFFGISDLIYKGQSDWVRAGSEAGIAEGLRKIGRLAGLNDDAMNACLSDGETLQGLVAWYQSNAETHGIKGTPSFVIDGDTYSNMPYSEFSALIDAKLAEE